MGGIAKGIDLDYFDDLSSMLESNFVKNFVKFQSLISPSYLLESPYKEILTAVASGDGKFYSALRKAKLSESLGEQIVQELVSLNILKIEFSRESPLRTHPKHKLKKELRSYRVQDKLRFVQPFLRFWFGFVMYYKQDLAQGKGVAFLENFQKHHSRLSSLVYEQLCNDLLEQDYATSSPIESSGSYWDVYNEFDILALTTDRKIILAECKYKERKISKNELRKLKAKAFESGIKVNVFALFSKSGFSKELLQMQDEHLLLFDLQALKRLL